MKIRAPEPRPSTPPVRRTAMQEAKRLEKDVVKREIGFARDSGFQKATGPSRDAKLKQIRKLVRPDFKDIYNGLKNKIPRLVLQGTTSIATRLGIVFAPPKGATPREMVTTLGQQIVSPSFTLDDRSSLKNLQLSTVAMLARTGPVKINDPDTSLRG